jgi:CHASE3 domain sensor protein
MSIRLLAKELYRLQQQVEKLEKELEDAPLDRHEHLQERLRSVRAERDHLRRVLDGQKDTPAKPRG